MRRLPSRGWGWTTIVVVVSAGPAAFFFPGHTRWLVVTAALAGWLLAYLLLRSLRSVALPDPVWRRSAQPGRAKSTPRRDYVVPTEVPPPPGLLIGREEKINQICAHLERPPGDTPRVVVITGPPGIGKYALAIGVAQILAGNYPDGQLLARLDRTADADRAAGADGTPDGGSGADVTHEVLGMFVRSLQGLTDTVPEAPKSRERRYRNLTVNRRVLVVLAGATDPAQVRRLLPRGRACAAIVTSRDGAGPSGDGWPADESWLPVPLDGLTEQAARRLLDTLIGGGRVEAERPPAQRIIEAAAGSPAALQIAGAALAAHRVRSLKWAVQQMDEVRLSPRRQRDLPDATRVLDLSYALLTESERRAFGLLDLLDPPVAPWMLDALLHAAQRHGTEASSGTGERILDRLVSARLVERHIGDTTGVATYRMSEYVRPYAHARMLAHTTHDERERALAGLEDARRRHGQHSRAQLLRTQVYDLLENGDLPAALDTAREVLALCSDRKARAQTAGAKLIARVDEGLALAALAEVNVELGWIEDARQFATAALETETERSEPRALRCLGSLQRRVRQLDSAEKNLRRAVDTAEQLQDRAEVIRGLRELALVQALGQSTESALETVHSALNECDATTRPDRRHRPGVLFAHGVVLLAHNEPAAAERALAGADDLSADPELGQTLWRPWIGHQRALVALAEQRYERSRKLAFQAMERFREMRHRYGIAYCRLVIGRTHIAENSLPAAVPELQEALDTFRGCGDRWIEADTATVLAHAHSQARQFDQAAAALTLAVQGFGDLGDVQGRARAWDQLITLDLRRRHNSGEQRWSWMSARVPSLATRTRS